MLLELEKMQKDIIRLILNMIKKELNDLGYDL